jgi:uncharacterized damage-inducible protein DinB
MSDPARTIAAPSGMDREVGLLFAQLEECRRRTRETVLGMSTADLDRRPPGVPHSIGAHLLHIAGLEHWWIQRVALQQEIEESLAHEFAPSQLDSTASRALRGHDVTYYLGKLDEVRARTEAACWRLRDDDLDLQRSSPRDGAGCTVRWILAHLCDHEAHHRGQIALLKRLVSRGAPG